MTGAEFLWGSLQRNGEQHGDDARVQFTVSIQVLPERWLMSAS